MISGPSYAAKYSRIIDGFYTEVNSQQGTDKEKEDKVYAFVRQVKNSSKADFEEWYQLYSNITPIRSGRKKRAVSSIHRR